MQKKQLMLKACENLDQKFVNNIKEAEKKNYMQLVIKGNGLRRKSEERRRNGGEMEKARVNNISIIL